MNKKNIYGILACAMLSLPFAACDDFLQRDPISDITEDMMNNGEQGDKYTSGSQIESLLKSAYNDFGSEFFQLDLYIYSDGQSDNAYAGEDKAQTRQIDEYTMDANNGTAARDWKYLYAQIAKANEVIEWAPKVADPSFNENRRKEVVAEASFIRAWCYFYLVRIFGDVPLSLTSIPEISSENIETVYPLLYPNREPAEKVYEQIFKDLETALGTKEYSDDKFVACQPLVHALTAEVYATYGAPDKVQWDKVQYHASLVTKDTRYGLIDEFDELFAPREDGSALMHENGKESLFEIPYVSWETLGNWAYQMFFGTDWKKFNTPSTDLVRAFNQAGDTKRLNASIRYEDVSAYWTDPYWPTSRYPFCWKIRLNEKGNITLLRLAAVILLHAEAENELDNLDESKRLLKRVRDRAGLGEVKADNKEQMREAIALERRLELCFEGYRWFDLKRTGKAIQTMNRCSDHQNTYAKSSLTEEKLLWPIPQSERDNNDQLTQNPGY